MKKAICAFLMILLTMKIICVVTPFAKWTKTELVLNNGIVQRTIKLSSADGSFITSSYKPVDGDFNYFLNTNPDFQFEVNDLAYSGKGNWSLVDIRRITDLKEGDGASVTLISQDKKVELTLKYLLYQNSPAIRKSLFVNILTNKE